jgi:hypothetical protein
MIMACVGSVGSGEGVVMEAETIILGTIAKGTTVTIDLINSMVEEYFNSEGRNNGH